MNMRIILLTILFLGPLYYFNQDEEVEPLTQMDSVDSIKVLQGAPERIADTKIDGILTVDKPVEAPSLLVENTKQESSSPASDEEEITSDSEESTEEVQWTDLDEGWNNELKAMLGRLEPEEGEDIYKNYTKQQEVYQAELESLQNEKQQKTSDEAALEIDQLILQLDSKHQERLKDILGAHYEAVRDQYQQFMDTAEEQ
jgi:FtsZ-binding cell division protein ZapB